LKTVLGVVGILVGVALGAYVGLWVCFIGGIIGLINAVVDITNGLGVDAMLIGFSIFKIMIAGLAGYISAVVLILPSLQLLK